MNVGRIEPLKGLTETTVKTWLLNAKDQDILVDIAKVNADDPSHSLTDEEKLAVIVILTRVYDKHGEVIADWIDWAAKDEDN